MDILQLNKIRIKMNLIRRAVLIILLAGIFAQPAYSMDFITIARIIEYIRPHATKIGWYGVNKAGWFLIGNGPVIAATSWIVYVYVKKCLIDKLQRDLGEVREDVKVVKEDAKEIKRKVNEIDGKVDNANNRLENIGNEQNRQGVVIGQIEEKAGAIDNRLGNMQNQLTGVATNVEQIKTEHTEALFSIAHEQQEQGEKIDIALKDISSNKEALKIINNNIVSIDARANELVIQLRDKTIDKDALEKQLTQLREDRGFLLKQIEELKSDNRAASESLEEEFGITKEKLSTLDGSLTSLAERVNKFIMETSAKFDTVNGHLTSIDENQATMLQELKELRAQKDQQDKIIKELLGKVENQQLMLGKLLNLAERNETSTERLTTSVTNLEKMATAAFVKNSNVKALPSTGDNQSNLGLRTGIFSGQTFGLKGMSSSIIPSIYPNQPLPPNYLPIGKN